MDAAAKEPSLLIGAVTSGIGLLTALGFVISDAQGKAFVAFVASMAMIGQAVITRQNVFAPASVAQLPSPSYEGDEHKHPAGDA